ncbi:MAG: pyridoxal phosphate-dependent aminotransferase [Hyphomicrobiaceae bacterium]
MANELKPVSPATIAASARSDIASFIVMDVMRQAAEKEALGERVIHMEVGQPGTPAPSTARSAVVDAMKDEPLGYTLALGRQSLRQRIARHYKDTYQVDVEPSQIVVTTGSSAAFVLSFLALFDAGARVALASPGYPCYRHILTALGQEPVIIQTGPETRWMPTPDDVERLARDGNLQGLLIASPANPTGTMLEPQRLADLAKVCDRYGVRFISDEIYHGLSYDMPAQTLLSHTDTGVVINSFSKYFSMTGWRVGWMVVPKPLVRAVERLAQNFFISAPTVSQVAAEAAFDAQDELNANCAVYAENRNVLLQGLGAAGFEKLVPADGAFYLYCDVSEHTQDSLAFARRLLDETGVAVTPGIDFDPVRGHSFIRFSYAGPTADMKEAVERLKAWKR